MTSDLMHFSKFFLDYITNIQNFNWQQIIIQETSKTHLKSMPQKSQKIINQLKALKKENPDNEGLEFLIKKNEIEMIESPKRFKNSLESHHLLYLFSQLQLFLFKTINYIILKRPNIISEKKISIKFVLDNKYNWNVILEKKIEKVILNLFFKEWKEIFDYLFDPLGLQHGITNQEMVELEEFSLLRNLYAHGDGTVTYIYLQKSKRSDIKYGDKIDFDEKYLEESQRLIFKVLQKIDQKLIISCPELIYKFQ